MYQYIFQYISIYIFCSLSYHESNLSLIARETMPLLVNRQLVPVAIQLKSISLEKRYCRTVAIALHKQDNFLNKPTKIISKCRHSNKYNLANYETED